MSQSVKPPDGGYGWVIVFAAGLTQCFSGPTLAMYGLLFGPKFDKFGSSSTERNSVFATFIVTWCVMSLFAGPLVQMRGSRFVAFCGTLLNVLGLIILALSSCTELMFLGYGFVMGAGMGLNSPNNILIMNKYFKKRISTAYGLYATSLTVFQLVLPQLVTFLLKHFSDQTTIFLYAACTSVGFIGSFLMKPVDEYLIKESKTELESGNIEPLMKSSMSKDDNEESMKKPDKFSFLKVFTMINWKLLRDPYFISIALGNSFVFNSVLSYLSQYVAMATEKGLSLDQCAHIISAASATEIASKLILGFLGDLPWLGVIFQYPRKSIYLISSLGVSLCMLGMTFSYNYLTVIISVVVGSIFFSAIMINTALVYAEVFPEDLASALGISNLCRAALAFIVGPIIGALKESSGNFDLALYFLMSLIILSMVLWIVMDVCRYRLKKSSPK